MMRYSILVALLVKQVTADCLSNPEYNEFFAEAAGGPIPQEGSCCQKDVCGIPCPLVQKDPETIYGVMVGLVIAISFVLGILTYVYVKGDATNYFVAGRTLPLWITAFTLGAQSVDSNSLLGNVDYAYRFQFFDGAVIPIGLGLSLIINGIFLAEKINREGTLTLPDVLSRRYGKTVEVMVSLCTITSFLMLLAGNLVGMGVTTAYVWGTTETAGIWLGAVIIWGYTVTGGLFSVAYTDVAQGMMGWPGCMLAAFWFIANSVPAAPASVGFPNYIYPNQEICDAYEGVPCENDPTACCYNATKWCPSDDNCFTDNGAYPTGDKRVYLNQMFYYASLSPFPNAIFWNWCTVLILAFGNLGALDFQVRCMAAKTPSAARYACFIAGSSTILIGVPFAFLGATTRAFYGPDSPFAVFEADTCSESLMLPTCGEWVPDDTAFFKLLTNQAPAWVGAWCLIGIVAASMSTADGAILAMGTVFSHNIMRQLDPIFPGLITSDNLLLMARISTVPFTIISTLIASLYRNSDKAAGATGYLLIVAFDVVLATVVPPLFGCFYTKNPSPRAAFCAIVAGASARLIMEFTLPKDGFLLLPYDIPAFHNYGTAASTGFPPFVDAPESDVWDPTVEVCVQELYRDFTGVDSLSAFLLSIIVFVTVQFVEHHRGKALFDLPGLEPYTKVIEGPKIVEDEEESADPDKGAIEANLGPHSEVSA